MKKCLTLCCIAVFSVGCGAAPPPVAAGSEPATPPGGGEVEVANQQVEVGLVKWQRNLDEAKAESAKTNKPIMLLFQEVPG